MISRDAKLALIALVAYLLLSGRGKDLQSALIDPLARSLRLSRQQLLLIAAAGAAYWLWKSGDLKGGAVGNCGDNQTCRNASKICQYALKNVPFDAAFNDNFSGGTFCLSLDPRAWNDDVAAACGKDDPTTALGTPPVAGNYVYDGSKICGAVFGGSDCNRYVRRIREGELGSDVKDCAAKMQNEMDVDSGANIGNDG